ncbi:MAG TPA: monovalent cation/H(+) antiporter subunit G [Salinisphaeraceae bacterium]|nr:monovalent cation/H(+) antiporter subunit G [Salinisphaeraceae bacterium]
MNSLQALPAWAALLVGALVLCGAVLACIGSAGLLRLRNFYRRVHAPTLGTTLGLYLMLVAAILFFSLQQGRPVLHLILIGACVTVTTPITLMLLVRAALSRDRKDGVAGVPPGMVPEPPDETAAAGESRPTGQH